MVEAVLALELVELVPKDPTGLSSFRFHFLKVTLIFGIGFVGSSPGKSLSYQLSINE